MIIDQAASKEQLLKEITGLRSEVAYLKEQLTWFQRQVFGKRSERVVKNLDDHQPYLPGFEELFQKSAEESEEKEKTAIASHTRRKVKRLGQDKLVYPDDLPVERIEMDIPKAEKVCAKTGKPLVKIGEEITRLLCHKPGSYFIRETVRPKYTSPKGAEEKIHIAELPDRVIPKCRADESLLAEVLTSKFADHLPLYRISEIFARDGVGISRQLLSQWVVKIGKALEPLYDEMLKRVIQSKNLFVDESPVNVLLKGRGKAHKAYMWVIVGGDPPYCVYNFRLSRRHENIADLIKDYTGNLHSDKYGAYEKLAAKKSINWNPCWSHIRRKFVEVEAGDLEFRDWMVRKIRYLFMFERVAWNRTPEERLKIRREKESPLIDEMIEAVKKKLYDGKLLPKTKLRLALGYFYGLVPYLKNYTKDPFSRLDNNVAERAIRPLALGRKNWLFMGSSNGGKSAATILSLVQTCRKLEINPRDYLEDVLRRLMGHSRKNLWELLPDHWAVSHRSG